MKAIYFPSLEEQFYNIINPIIAGDVSRSLNYIEMTPKEYMHIKSCCGLKDTLLPNQTPYKGQDIHIFIDVSFDKILCVRIKII